MNTPHPRSEGRAAVHEIALSFVNGIGQSVTGEGASSATGSGKLEP